MQIATKMVNIEPGHQLLTQCLYEFLVAAVTNLSSSGSRGQISKVHLTGLK